MTRLASFSDRKKFFQQMQDKENSAAPGGRFTAARSAASRASLTKPKVFSAEKPAAGGVRSRPVGIKHKVGQPGDVCRSSGSGVGQMKGENVDPRLTVSPHSELTL